MLLIMIPCLAESQAASPVAEIWSAQAAVATAVITFIFGVATGIWAVWQWRTA